MNIYIYICVCISIKETLSYICLYVCAYVSPIKTQSFIYIYIYIYIYVYIYIYICVCVFICQKNLVIFNYLSDCSHLQNLELGELCDNRPIFKRCKILVWIGRGYKVDNFISNNNNRLNYWASSLSVCLCTCLMSRVFASGPEDQGSIASRVIQNIQKLYLMPLCFTLSIIRYGSRVKWRNPGNWAVSSSRPRCSSKWKDSFQVTFEYSCQLYIYIYIYIYIYCYPHTDCFVVSQFIGVAWDARYFEWGSKLGIHIKTSYFLCVWWWSQMYPISLEKIY